MNIKKIYNEFGDGKFFSVQTKNKNYCARIDSSIKRNNPRYLTFEDVNKDFGQNRIVSIPSRVVKGVSRKNIVIV